MPDLADKGWMEKLELFPQWRYGTSLIPFFSRFNCFRLRRRQGYVKEVDSCMDKGRAQDVFQIHNDPGKSNDVTGKDSLVAKFSRQN